MSPNQQMTTAITNPSLGQLLGGHGWSVKVEVLLWLGAGNGKHLDDEQGYPEAALSCQQTCRQSTDTAPGQPQAHQAGPCGSGQGCMWGLHQEGNSRVHPAHTYCFNGIFQNAFCPGREKEAHLLLPKAGVNMCVRGDTCSTRASQEPGCSEGASRSAGTACAEQLIAAGRRHTEAAGRNREG